MIVRAVLRIVASASALVALYYVLPLNHIGGRLTYTDGLYFAVTVFSTVGFGDITAKTEAAPLVVTGQMIGDIVILGLALKITLGAVNRRRQQGDVAGTQPAQRVRR